MSVNKWMIPKWMVPGSRAIINRGRNWPQGTTGTIKEVFKTGCGPQAIMVADNYDACNKENTIVVWVYNLDQLL